MWQDWLISAVQWMFAFALIPSIIHPTNKPALSSSLMTAGGLFVIAGTFTTLGLWSSFFSCTAAGIAWSILAYQKWRLDKRATDK